MGAIFFPKKVSAAPSTPSGLLKYEDWRRFWSRVDALLGYDYGFLGDPGDHDGVGDGLSVMQWALHTARIAGAELTSDQLSAAFRIRLGAESLNLTYNATAGANNMSNKVPIAAIFLVLRLCPSIGAATLKPETVSVWDSYLAAAHAAMLARLQPGAHFLWLDEEPDRREHVRRVGPYILPASPHIPRRVPSGLIHDWLGAGFIPNAKIEDILRIVRDYDRYKEIYKPGVIDSISHGTDGAKDLFSLRLVNRSVVAKTALDSDYEASYIEVDDQHWYGFCNSTHIQQVDKFGTPEQRTLPEDQGTGLIWRLSSITRLEERDGGVYAELEAIALSRDIPAAFRVFVTPIVRRVSRDSLAVSLHQTKVAIDNGMAHGKQERPAQ